LFVESKHVAFMTDIKEVCLTAIRHFYSIRNLVQGTTVCGVSHKKYTIHTTSTI